MARPVRPQPQVFLLAALGLAFWMAGGSLRPEATNALTLNDCLRESLSANHVLLARSAESDAAGSRAQGSAAARWPKLFVQAGAMHTSDPYRLQPATENNQPAVFTHDTWQAVAGVGVPLYAGGRLAAEPDAACLLAEAASGDFAFARQALAARIRAVLEEQASALTVPLEALLGDGVQSFVFVLAEDKAARRVVETGFEQDGRLWIRSGLNLGDCVIVGGIERVKDGAAVRLEGGPAKSATGKKPTANERE